MTTLWMKFRYDCPIVSVVPVLRHWCFGLWVRGYEQAKASGA